MIRVIMILAALQAHQWRFDYELATHTPLVLEHFVITTQSDYHGVYEPGFSYALLLLLLSYEHRSPARFRCLMVGWGSETVPGSNF